MTDLLDPADNSLCLYGSFDSANLIVRFALEELGLPYRFVEINRANRANRSAEYLKFNPQGLMPVLVDPSQSAPLFETAGILLYLADREGRLAPEPRASDRGAFLTWLFFMSNTLHSDMRVSFRPQRYVEGDASCNALKVGLESRIRDGFDHLETCAVKSGGPYLLGAELSVLDFYAATLCRWFQLYPHQREFDVERWPKLVALIELLQQREAVLRAQRLELISGTAFLNPVRPDLDEAALTGV
ncbi:glutathione S-transferase family protein [Roseibium algae]|uniref:Glutathione S-transferase family protein n=1 Tax=Roseibium algae TaxID=3123038 RepID=A0ABU8TGQ1_9HYPH